MDWLAIISRWTHVGTAIVLVGGTVFLRFIVIPVTTQLPDAEQSPLKLRVLAAWKQFIHVGIVLFLVSGFYNYLVVAAPLHKGDKLYHPLIGTKILLALGMFFLASALVGKAKVFEGLRRHDKFWQSVILMLATIIVGISGFAKVAVKAKLPVPSVESSAVSR